MILKCYWILRPPIGRQAAKVVFNNRITNIFILSAQPDSYRCSSVTRFLSILRAVNAVI